MKILVDADACAVKNIILKIAKKYNIDTHLFFDTSHVIKDDFAKMHILDKGKDSVDLALINFSNCFDIIITQDYGLACLGLSKKCYVINQNGLLYDNQNIDSLIQSRYVSAKLRKSGTRIKGPKKRDKSQDNDFEHNFKNLILKLLKS